MTADPWALLREARTFVYVAASRLREDGRETSTEKAISVCRQIDAALAKHDADEKRRMGYGDRLIALAKAEERKQHFQQGYTDAVLAGLKREDALKRADEYAEEKMQEWK